jgi:hypothetical protein
MTPDWLAFFSTHIHSFAGRLIEPSKTLWHSIIAKPNAIPLFLSAFVQSTQTRVGRHACQLQNVLRDRNVSLCVM